MMSTDDPTTTSMRNAAYSILVLQNLVARLSAQSVMQIAAIEALGAAAGVDVGAAMKSSEGWDAITKLPPPMQRAEYDALFAAVEDDFDADVPEPILSDAAPKTRTVDPVLAELYEVENASTFAPPADAGNTDYILRFPEMPFRTNEDYALFQKRFERMGAKAHGHGVMENWELADLLHVIRSDLGEDETLNGEAPAMPDGVLEFARKMVRHPEKETVGPGVIEVPRDKVYAYLAYIFLTILKFKGADDSL